jgi:hypothetical protein
MPFFLAWFLPAPAASLENARAAVVMAASLLLILVILIMLIFWKITKDLQRWTVFASLGIILFLIATTFLARGGYGPAAASLLAGLLFLLALADIFFFGVSSIGGSVLIVPILLATFGLGESAGWIVALLCSFALWGCAWGEASGNFSWQTEHRRDAWTFHAPALTALYFLVAAIASSWSFAVINF